MTSTLTAAEKLRRTNERQQAVIAWAKKVIAIEAAQCVFGEISREVAITPKLLAKTHGAGA